ncbi:MAG TPA: LamG-like jellyroll fold domain-containing protein [Thermomonospora sp.]|nr:LamG-like jellyroll fold domain-containing protein [Thermomonospora sp.]
MTDTSSPPEPRTAATAAEYVSRLRALRAWAGLTYRQVERHAEAAGHSLPHSTLASALSRDKLPREDLVVAFVRACGCDEEETAAWVEARRRLAALAESAAAPAETMPEPEPGAAPPPFEPPPAERDVIEEPPTIPAPVASSPPRAARGPGLWTPGGMAALITVFALGLAIGWWLDEPDAPRADHAPPAAASRVPQMVADPGRPVAWWRFDDTTPRSARDESGEGLALSLGEGVRRERRGKVDAILTDGTGRILTTRPPVNTDESFSLTAWVRLDRTGDWSIVASQHDGPYDVFLLGHNREVDRWGFMTPTEEDGWLSGQALSTTPPRRGVWTHLAGVYDAGGRRLRLYVNGELAGTSRTHALRRAREGLELGGAVQHGKPVDPWHGAIDDVRVYRGVLTPAAVAEVMRTRA